MVTSQQAVLFAYGSLILFVGGLLYLRRWNRKARAKAKADYEERQRPNREEYAAWLAEQKKTARYILTHNPTPYDIQQIMENPAKPWDKDLAIKTALASGDLGAISLVTELAPEYSDEALMASNDILFARFTDQQALEALESWRYLDDRYGTLGNWWRAWKPKLEAQAQRVIDRRRADEEAASRHASTSVEEESSVWDDDGDYWDPDPIDWSSG